MHVYQLMNLWNHHPFEYDLFGGKTWSMLSSVGLLELTSPLWMLMWIKLWL